MNDLPISGFQQAIQATHGAKAELVERVPVHETFEGDVVWTGEVLVFQLQGHPTASRCYAWEVYAWEVGGEVIVVLHRPPVDSPVAAVRASIVAGKGEDS